MLAALPSLHGSTRRVTRDEIAKKCIRQPNDREPPEKDGYVYLEHETCENVETTYARSSPVAVPCPTRSQTSSRTASRHGSRSGSKNRNKAEFKLADDAHDASSVSPAVAALLAMTSTASFKKISKADETKALKQRQMSLSELVEEWHTMDMGDATPLASSPRIEMLLSPPDHDSLLDRRTSAEEVRRHFPFPSRSQSNESMPSLDSDSLSMTSSYEPATPQASLRGASYRRERRMSSPSSIDCVLDHPLLHDNDAEDEEEKYKPPSAQIQKANFKPTKPSKLRLQRSISSFRSNLTASFQSLRSVATRVSHYSSPSLPPEDHLSRSIFSPSLPTRSEMRPSFIIGTPPAELRRYLNPNLGEPIRSSPHDFHLHNSYLDQTDLPSIASISTSAHYPYSTCAIPMKTYTRCENNQHSDTKSSDSTIVEPDRVAFSPSLKQREPRENSQFLRVCVLEMNMKRRGKLDPNAAFKAQFWLPPRQVGMPKLAARNSYSSLDSKAIPARWRGVVTA